MLHELNQELAQIQEKQWARQRLQRMVESAQERLARERRQLEALEAALEKEGADLEKLEGLSLAGLFYTVLGEKEIKLKKERQEFLSVKLKAEQSRQVVAALEQELAALARQLQPLGDLDAQVQALLAQKAEVLAAEKPETAEQVEALWQAETEAERQRQELREAIGAGKELLQELVAVVELLKSAEGWGTFDLIGGGILSTSVKHSKLDQARARMPQIQSLLARFKDELDDLGQGVMVEELAPFDRLADFFLDGLIFDWMVQKKIRRSLEQTESVKSAVEGLLSDLRRELKATQERAAELRAEREALVLKA